MAAAAAILIRKENEVVEVFERAGATSPSSAKSLGALQLEDDRALHRLRRHAIVREAEPGLLYVDAPGWYALKRRRRMVAACAVIGVAIITIIVSLRSRNILSP